MPETLNWGDMYTAAQAEGGAVSYEPLPAAEYEVVVDEATVLQARSGKMMIKLAFKVIDLGPHQNRKVWNNVTITPENPKAMSMFFQNMGILGLTMENWFSRNPSLDETAAALSGRVLRIRVKIGSYDGKATNEVDRMMPSKTVGTPPAQAAPAPQQFAAPAPQQYAPPPQAPQQYAPAPAPQQPAPYQPPQQYAPAPAPQQPAPYQPPQQYAPPPQAPQQYDPNAAPLPRPF